MTVKFDTLVRIGVLAAVIGPACAAELISAELTPPTQQAFEAYMRKAEARLQAQAQSSDFLWVDRAPDRKPRALAGSVLAEPFVGDGDVAISGGLVHDWVGAVFIPGVTLERVLRFVQDYDNHKNVYKPEVLDSKLLKREGDEYTVSLRLLKKKVITVVLNTDHDVRYFRGGEARAYSQSYSTRIAEVQDPGKPGEHELPPGKDHGFLWRLNSFWRFEQRDGGVYVECEAISLTRDVPTGLGWLINPIIRSLPEESLAATLTETRQGLARSGATVP
ncbi:MAG TPA: hypothetical protein VMU19_03695 [Bryobacteraceae bacterium]|nr:hypothetical protein [Bryobacteraceae bacterium]